MDMMVCPGKSSIGPVPQNSQGSQMCETVRVSPHAIGIWTPGRRPLKFGVAVLIDHQFYKKRLWMLVARRLSPVGL